VLIVGTGAVGTLLAERFHRYGIRFQMFGPPSERLRALELRYPGHTVSRCLEIARHDQWIVALKTSQNPGKVQFLQSAPRPQSILVLQNGLSPESEWTPLAPRVDRALSTYGVKSVGPGRIESGASGQITLPEGSSFTTLLRQAGFCLREVRDMASAIWRKLAVNASLNVVATVFGVANGKVLESPEALRLTRLACEDVADVARAFGMEWGPRTAWELTQDVARGTAGNICSTLADVRAGRPTEYQAINGEVLAVADRLGLAVPTLRHLDRAFLDLIESRSRTACA
jgi:2-dehydropantoate 2-reductase